MNRKRVVKAVQQNKHGRFPYARAFGIATTIFIVIVFFALRSPNLQSLSISLMPLLNVTTRYASGSPLETPPPPVTVPLGAITQIASFPWSSLKGSHEHGTGVVVTAWIKNPGPSQSFDSWNILVNVQGKKVIGETRTIPDDLRITGSNGAELCNNSDSLNEKTASGVEHDHAVFGIALAYFRDTIPQADINLDTVTVQFSDGSGHKWEAGKQPGAIADGRVWRSPGVCRIKATK